MSLAPLSVLQSGLILFSRPIVVDSKITTSNTILAMLQPGKRLRVDAGGSAARISSSDVSADETFGKVGFTKTTTKVASTVVKASNGFELHPLPGFEPSPLSGSRSQEQDQEQEAGVPIADGQEVVELDQKQKMRMELNKAVARARRNLRMCEEHISESQRQGKIFPDFRNLLVEQSWLEVLENEFGKQYMSNLQTFVQQEAAGNLAIYPPPALVFSAFNTCPFDKVKVVIIGQDPYHGSGQAMGLCFSVPHGTKVPSSLVNIFKEISNDVGSRIPAHGNLEKWAHQGVLLLNAVLTVRDHHANSHAKKGWEPFTDSAIRAVSQKKKGVVFLLWGNSAHEKTRLINIQDHHVLKAAHPSGLSAHRGFFECRHFSKTNQILEKAGKLPIDWQL